MYPGADAPQYVKAYATLSGDVDLLAAGPGGNCPCWGIEVGVVGDVTIVNMQDETVLIEEENWSAGQLKVLQAKTLKQSGTAATKFVIYWRV